MKHVFMVRTYQTHGRNKGNKDCDMYFGNFLNAYGVYVANCKRAIEYILRPTLWVDEKRLTDNEIDEIIKSYYDGIFDDESYKHTSQYYENF